MKLLVIFLFVLETLLLATSALPLFAAQNQQAIANPLPRTPPSSVNSFDSSSSSSSSSSSDPGSSRGGGKKFSIPNPLRKSSSSEELRCHRYPQNSILGELAAYVTELLRSYRETVSAGKGDRERPLFETCYAGYGARDAAPSIYFGDLKAKQAGVLEKLFRSRLPVRYPGVKIVKTSNAIAVVMEDEHGIRRRNTV